MEQNDVLKHPARIWTFDGGGPGVISQLIIVNEIMHRIQWTLKLDFPPRPCEYAELMVGSELGAVAVILLARLCLTAEQTLIHLVELGQSVFLEPNEPKNGYQFDVERLRKSTSDILRLYGLTDTTKMIEEAIMPKQAFAAVTSTPTSNLSNCRFIRTYRTPSAEYNCTIVEAALASVALPSWFPSMKIGPRYLQESLTAGALSFNNPTKKALDEAKACFGSKSTTSVVLSLGSGRRSAINPEHTTKDRSRGVLDDMAQSGEQTAEELLQRFGGFILYQRFSVDSGLENLSITGWTKEELGSITTHTKVYIERVSSSLSMTVELLVKNQGCITLGQLTQFNVKSDVAKSIPRLSPFFVEHDVVLESMQHGLVRDPCNIQRTFVIFGMGGSGKTQTASCFGRRNRDRYKYIFFVDASSDVSIKTDLQSALRSIGGMHSQATFEDTLRFLAHRDNRGWLIIFDNADNPKLRLTPYFPECDHGTVIITGRNRALSELAPTSYCHLQGMEESDSIKLLLKSAKREEFWSEEESTAAAKLCRLLGGLPLTLVHVGCYCYMNNITFLQYLERFRMYRSKLMEMEPPSQLDNYNYNAYTSIRFSYSLLDEQARNLLHLLTFFHYSSIRLDILFIASKYGFRSNPDWDLLPRQEEHNRHINILRELLIPDGSWNDIYIDSLLNRLQSLSLISLSYSNSQINITIHPLVQSCIRDTLSPAGYSLYFYMAVLVLSTCSRGEEIILLQHLPAHIAELESCKRYIHPNELAGVAYILYCNGNYEEAMKRWVKARDECRTVNSEEHRSIVQMSYWIATCLYNMYKYEDAEVMIRGVVKAQERVLGEADDDVLDSCQLLARIPFSEESKREEARSILKRVLALSETKYGQEHRVTLGIQSSLADNLFNQGRYSHAEAISRNILPVMKKVLGVDNEVTLYTSHILSLVLIGQEKWAEAEDILNEVIIEERKKYGNCHPEALISLYNFALCLIHREELSEAERILQEVLEIRKGILGNEHPHTIYIYKQLEYVTQRKGFLRLSYDQSPSSLNQSGAVVYHESSHSSQSKQLSAELDNIWKSFQRSYCSILGKYPVVLWILVVWFFAGSLRDAIAHVPFSIP